MTFPGPHFLLAISGPLYTDERWSMTMRFSDPGAGFAGSPAAGQTAVNAMSTAVQAGLSSSELPMGQQAKLDLVKLNRIGPDGRYADGWTNLAEIPTPVAGGFASTHPPQVALAITLETGFTRGLAHRGRIFVPAPRFPVGADGRMSAANALTVAQVAATFFQRLNAVQPGLRLIVASNVGGGASRPVTGCSVGRVLDTIRTRRASLEEERASVNVQAPT